MSSSKNENINNFSIYQNGLGKKEKKMFDLQNQFNTLIQNKNRILFQTEKVNNLSQINNPIKNEAFQSNNITNNNLLSLVQKLQQENTFLKNKLNLELEYKNDNTIIYQLFNAQKEIENLTKLNSNKDSIIMNMQNFINNINKVISNGKINLNLNIIDIQTFIINLKELEQKIISKLQKNPISIIKKEKEKESKMKKQKTDKNINIKKNFYNIPLYNKIMKLNYTIYNSINNKKINIKNLNHSLNKNNHYKNIRCIIWRNKSKKNGQFHLQKNKLRLREFLITKSGEVYSRTPKKEHIKSFEGEYYRNYLKTINNEIGNWKINIKHEKLNL